VQQHTSVNSWTDGALAEERYSDRISADEYCTCGNRGAHARHSRIANDGLSFDANYKPRSNYNSRNRSSNARNGSANPGYCSSDAGNGNTHNSGYNAGDDSNRANSGNNSHSAEHTRRNDSG
jgi:hypothetical protein